MPSRFFAWGCLCVALCALSWQPSFAEQGKNASVPQWVYIPAGSRAAYIGIHGGTVPVSLLTSRDGTHMVALVGQTGNDFLRTLKVDPGTAGATPSTSQTPAQPSAPDAEEREDSSPLRTQTSAVAVPHSRLTANATLLMVDTAAGAMPVIYATGHSFASLSQLYTDSLLFGLADNSPLLEGAVKTPFKAAKKIKIVKRQPLTRASSELFTQ